MPDPKKAAKPREDLPSMVSDVTKSVTTTTDPLEASKLQKPEEPPAKVVSKPAEPVPPPEAAAPPEEPPKRAPRYRVKREVPVHINGCLTHLMAGQVVDVNHYGFDAIERMKVQGAELEEIV